jgi:hypothetical protein
VRDSFLLANPSQNHDKSSMPENGSGVKNLGGAGVRARSGGIA